MTWITHCTINYRCVNWKHLINIIHQAALSSTEALSCCFLEESHQSQAARASETLCSCCSAHRHYNVVMQLSLLEALCTCFLEAYGRVAQCCWEASIAWLHSITLITSSVPDHCLFFLLHSWISSPFLVLYWSHMRNIEIEHYNYGLNDSPYIYHDNKNVLCRTNLFMWGSLRLAQITGIISHTK